MNSTGSIKAEMAVVNIQEYIYVVMCTAQRKFGERNKAGRGKA